MPLLSPNKMSAHLSGSVLSTFLTVLTVGEDYPAATYLRKKIWSKCLFYSKKNLPDIWERKFDPSAFFWAKRICRLSEKKIWSECHFLKEKNLSACLRKKIWSECHFLKEKILSACLRKKIWSKCHFLKEKMCLSFLLYLDLYWSSCPAHFDVEVSPALDKAMASDAVDVSSGNILLFFWKH